MPARKPERKTQRLAMGEYLLSDPIGARRELINAIKTEVPEFFEQLRECVYPAFVPLAHHWKDELPTLEMVLDRESRLRDALLQWARHFNAEESWILEGAVALLWHWHRYPEM